MRALGAPARWLLGSATACSLSAQLPVSSSSSPLTSHLAALYSRLSALHASLPASFASRPLFAMQVCVMSISVGE